MVDLCGTVKLANLQNGETTKTSMFPAPSLPTFTRSRHALRKRRTDGACALHSIGPFYTLKKMIIEIYMYIIILTNVIISTVFSISTLLFFFFYYLYYLFAVGNHSK